MGINSGKIITLNYYEVNTLYDKFRLQVFHASRLDNTIYL